MSAGGAVAESPVNSLLAVVGASEHLAQRARKYVALYVVAAAATQLAQRTWRRAEAEVTYTITVDSGEDIYPDVQAWVLERVPKARLRSLSAHSSRVTGLVSSEAVEEHRELRVFYDGRRTQTVAVGAHRARVSIETDEMGTNRDRDGGWQWKRDRVVFSTRGPAARDAVLDVLRGMAEARNRRREVRTRVATTWGDWIGNPAMPARRLDSVILRRGLLEDLVADLGRFLDQEDRYAALGIPWHRGYLFEGPPGTGKTSVARALAQRFWLDVHFVPLAAVPNDSVLMRLLATVPPRAMLLIEDIDIVHASRKRDDSEPGVSMSGLLNALDGVVTPHGMVTVITTNKPEVLDEALLREGRIDRRVELDVLDEDQLQRLVAHALSGPCPPLPPLARPTAPAEILEAVKHHLDDPRAALAAVEDLLRSEDVLDVVGFR